AATTEGQRTGETEEGLASQASGKRVEADLVGIDVGECRGARKEFVALVVTVEQGINLLAQGIETLAAARADRHALATRNVRAREHLAVVGDSRTALKLGAVTGSDAGVDIAVQRHDVQRTGAGNGGRVGAGGDAAAKSAGQDARGTERSHIHGFEAADLTA